MIEEITMNEVTTQLQLMDNSRAIARDVRIFLATRTTWTTSATITRETGHRGTAIRAACQAYPRTFVSSTFGYKLALYATRGELQHNVASLISRSTKMLVRASELSTHLARRVI